MTHRPAPARTLAAVLAGAAVATLVAVGPAASATAPGSNPTPKTPTTPADVPTSGSKPADLTNLAAARLAKLQQKVAAQQRTMSRLTARASFAEQQYVKQLAGLRSARAAQSRAAAQLAAANSSYQRARAVFTHVVVAYYESGAGLLTSSTVQLLLSDDPGKALQTAASGELLAVSQGDVVHSLQRERARRTAAERTQRTLLADVQRRTDQLATTRAGAQADLDRAKRILVSLRADLTAANTSQQQAIATLSGYLGGWSSADPRRAGALDAKYRKIADAGLGRKPKFDPRHPRWTAALGRYVAFRALNWLGTPYAWSGGGAAGPTRGVCTGGDARNDCKLVGFDCSGLTLHAWAPYRGMAHFAATQYSQAGRLHPAVAELKAGDLVFWSGNSKVSGIHHVAMYIGDGLTVQAPQSGDIVRVTPLAYVSGGYFGATRPLT